MGHYDNCRDDHIPEVGKIVLVPREPTREMWAASATAVCDLQARGIGHHDKISEAVYEAMLAAAPQPSMEGGVGKMAEEERDALLRALGFKPGPMGSARDVILKDAAGLRPEMVRARNAERDLKSDRDWDRLAAAELLRKWVKRKFGRWITWRTAWAAVDEIRPDGQALSEGEQR